MTKSELFTAAHKIAKATVANVGNYMIALSLALKSLYETAKMTIKAEVVKLANNTLRIFANGEAVHTTVAPTLKEELENLISINSSLKKSIADGKPAKRRQPTIDRNEKTIAILKAI